MSTNWETAIPQIIPGTPVDAASINTKLSFLAGRDQFLFEQLNSYSDKTAVLSYNQPMKATGVEAGTPVYFYTEQANTAVLYPAKAGYTTSSSPAHLVPSASAFVFGIVKAVYSNSETGARYGDVYIYGLVEGLSFAALMDTASYTGNEPTPGPLYLSSAEEGKFTKQPTGAAIFVGYITGNTANTSTIFLAPNIDSLNQMYFNYKLWLNPEAAGIAALIEATTPDTWTVIHKNQGGDVVTAAADIATKIGWVTADDAHDILLLDKPTGASFYYNVPPTAYLTEANGFTAEEIRNALLYKEALPPYPGAYTMLFMNGVLQSQYSADHTAGSYIINEDGIWWVDNETGYQPFGLQQNGDPLVIDLLITKLNPFYSEALVTSLTSESSMVEVLDAKTLLPATTGELTLKVNPEFSDVSAGATGTCLQTAAFDPATQKFVRYNSPVINSIASGVGISSRVVNGAATISLTSALTGEVSDIEPEEADYVYKGLHSYLRLKRPVANQRVGFVGKLLLPQSLLTGAKLNIKLLAFGENSKPSESVVFVFEYSVSKVGSTISTAVGSTSATVADTVFVANTLAEVYKNGTTPYFSVPAEVLAPGAYVNFRIARTNIITSGTPTSIGIVGVSWVLE